MFRERLRTVGTISNFFVQICYDCNMFDSSVQQKGRGASVFYLFLSFSVRSLCVHLTYKGSFFHAEGSWAKLSLAYRAKEFCVALPSIATYSDCVCSPKRIDDERGRVRALNEPVRPPYLRADRTTRSELTELSIQLFGDSLRERPCRHREGPSPEGHGIFLLIPDDIPTLEPAWHAAGKLWMTHTGKVVEGSAFLAC